MKRRFRLTGAKDFERVRRLGKSYAHPLLVLVVLRNELGITRVGVAAGRSLGGAVQRNRAKRRMREALRPQLPNLQPGWDAILLGRRPLSTATYRMIQEALGLLLKRAHLLKEPHGE